MTLDPTARRYRIMETLGEGGFGKVYRAEMQATGGFLQEVALKIVSARTPQVEEAIRRLRDEARILGYLRHRAVIRTLGLTRLEPGWAIVLEYIDGADCAALVKHQTFPLRTVAEIAEDVAGALAMAWNTPGSGGQPLRVIHRDIKPANIRITLDGQVKVLDFGAARADFDAREANTRSHILGSYRYMAPERFHGIDGQPVDIYSLGLVMFQLLTGLEAPAQVVGQREHEQMVTSIASGLEQRIRAEGGEPTDVQASLVDLVLAMIAFHAEDRPTAAEVELICRYLRTELNGPLLRDWAPAALAKIPSKPQADAIDEWSGSVLIELASESAPSGPPRARGQRGKTATGKVLVMLASLGLLLGAGAGLAAIGGLALLHNYAPSPPGPATETAAADPLVSAPLPEPMLALATPPTEQPQPPPPAEDVTSATRHRAAPAPTHEAAPAPEPPVSTPTSPEPDPTTRVELTGDAREVTATNGGARVRLPANLQPGSYHLSATFADGETWSGEVSISGNELRLDCSSAFGKCKSR